MDYSPAFIQREPDPPMAQFPASRFQRSFEARAHELVKNLQPLNKTSSKFPLQLSPLSCVVFGSRNQIPGDPSHCGAECNDAIL